MDARATRAAAVATPAASMLAGCGTSDDRTAARLVGARFAVALQRDDGATACALLSEDAVKALEQEEGKPCRRAVSSLALGGPGITRVQVYVTNAKVDLVGGSSAFL